MQSPLVSIIIPCYNQGQYLDECLQSVVEQTYATWECIIVNDGSNDNSQERIDEWKKTDTRISSITIENNGVSFARNTGINAARGTFILPLDADDKISKLYVNLCVSAFISDPELILVYANAEKFGLINAFWELPEFSLRQLCKGNLIYNCAMYRKEDFLKVGGYDTQMKLGLEDWEFWIHLLKKNPKVFKIPEVCFYYRIKESSRNSGYSPAQEKQLKQYISSKHADVYLNLMGDFPQVLTTVDQLLITNKEFLSKYKPTFKNRIKFLLGLT